MLARLGLKKEQPAVPLPGSAEAEVAETQRLLEAGQIGETEASVRNYLATEGEATIATELPAIPETIKPLLLFQSYALLAEFCAFLIAVMLSFKYIFGGCLVVGFSMTALAGSLGYLSIPALMVPFSSNSLIRWFFTSSHSAHLTSLFSFSAIFVYLTYVSWFNTCPQPKLSAVFLTAIAASISLFLVACYRNEKGNGGYIRWLLKLVF